RATRPSFLYRSRHHAILHSFPTRRSSDLPSGRCNFRVSDMTDLLLLPGDGIGPEVIAQVRRIATRLANDLTIEERPFGGASYDRSEEHTSELQSRENLVCRLLLEKKKHNQ